MQLNKVHALKNKYSCSKIQRNLRITNKKTIFSVHVVQSANDEQSLKDAQFIKEITF